MNGVQSQVATEQQSESQGTEFPHLAYQTPVDRLRIDIVDDSRACLQLLRRLVLPLSPARIRLFEDPREALPRILNSPPHLLISDWLLGEISGTEMIGILRNRRFGASALISTLVITGLPHNHLLTQCLRVGVNQILTKPVSPRCMQSRIDWITRDPRKLTFGPRSASLTGAEETLNRIARDQPLQGPLDQIIQSTHRDDPLRSPSTSETQNVDLAHDSGMATDENALPPSEEGQGSGLIFEL